MAQGFGCGNVLLFFAGIGALSYGIFMFRDSYKLARHSEVSLGTVVKLELEWGKSLQYYSAIINFETRKGKHVEFKSKPLIRTNFGNWPVFVEGQLCPVRYHAQNPQKAIIDSFLYLWFPSVALVSMGIAALVVAIAMPVQLKGL